MEYDSEDTILGTSVKWDFVEERLRCALKTESRFGAHKKAIRTGMGQGFVSFIGRLYLDWVPKSEELPQTVIIKIPTVENWRQLMEQIEVAGQVDQTAFKDHAGLVEKFGQLMRRCHNTEVSFYEMMHTSGLQVKVPEGYVLQKFSDGCQGFIVMSDHGTDAVVLSLFNNITPAEIIQVFDLLAEIHAYSLAHPECFASIISTSFTDFFQLHDQESVYHGLLKAVTSLDEERLRPLTDEVREHLMEILDPTIIDHLHNEMGMKPVLSHGDLWTSNVMWKKDGQQNNLAAVLDWQLVHPGTPSEDIARMIAASLSAKDRRDNLDNILEHYYSKLTELLHTEPPFTFQQLKGSFIRIYALEMLLIAPALGPFMQVPMQDRPEEEKEQLTELMREKAVGLFEDILYYHKLNKGT